MRPSDKVMKCVELGMSLLTFSKVPEVAYKANSIVPSIDGNSAPCTGLIHRLSHHERGCEGCQPYYEPTSHSLCKKSHWTLLAVPEVSKVQENIDCSHSDPAASAASARSAVINDEESMSTTVPQSCLRLSNNPLLKILTICMQNSTIFSSIHLHSLLTKVMLYVNVLFSATSYKFIISNKQIHHTSERKFFAA